MLSVLLVIIVSFVVLVIVAYVVHVLHVPSFQLPTFEPFQILIYPSAAFVPDPLINLIEIGNWEIYKIRVRY